MNHFCDKLENNKKTAPFGAVWTPLGFYSKGYSDGLKAQFRVQSASADAHAPT